MPGVVIAEDQAGDLRVEPRDSDDNARVEYGAVREGGTPSLPRSIPDPGELLVHVCLHPGDLGLVRLGGNFPKVIYGLAVASDHLGKSRVDDADTDGARPSATCRSAYSLRLTSTVTVSRA